MNKINSLLFATILLVVSSSAVAEAQAQQPRPPNGARQLQPQNDQQQPAKPSNLRQLLNLTADQLQQIRAVNQDTRENVRAANLRQRAARRALDAAIYADAPNQMEVGARARELADAQSEAVKIRADVEFRIRQILTPEQLTRFRDLRFQFEQKMRQRLLFRSKSIPQSNNKPL